MIQVPDLEGANRHEIQLFLATFTEGLAQHHHLVAHYRNSVLFVDFRNHVLLDLFPGLAGGSGGRGVQTKRILSLLDRIMNEVLLRSARFIEWNVVEVGWRAAQGEIRDRVINHTITFMTAAAPRLR